MATTQKTMMIRTPLTTDGLNLAYDEDKQPLFAETTVPIAARKHFESLNAALPEHLRHEILDSEKPPAKKGNAGKGE